MLTLPLAAERFDATTRNASGTIFGAFLAAWSAVSFREWIRCSLLLSTLVTHASCALLGYDDTATGGWDEGDDQTKLEPDGGDARVSEVGDGGSSLTRSGDGSVSSPTQGSDAGESESGNGKFDACGLSSWLPGLIPDLSVIPNIPGITVPCASADAGSTASRDAGSRDAGSAADAGKPDAAAPPAGDAGNDATALDASADAAASDAAQDVSDATVTSDGGDAGGTAAEDAGDAAAVPPIGY
jgi:hypothetical protein